MRERINENDVILIDRDPYCRDCVKYCERCGCYHTGDSYETEDGVVCADCYEIYYTVCEHCEEVLRNEHIIETDDGYYFCTDCAADNTTVCEYCQDIFVNKNIYYDEVTGCYYCKECYERVIKERNEEIEGE